MAQWNAEQYLKFKNQRTQPAYDLARRIEAMEPELVLDLGCGPGNSTQVLKDRFPKSRIVGIDNSEDMIEKAKATYPDTEFRVMDITKEYEELKEADIIFSNACLQWIPNHREFIPKIFRRLKKGGVLAVQIPINQEETLFQILNETVQEEKWNLSDVSIEPNDVLASEEYFDILASLTSQFDIWETVYYHNMPSVEAMVEWIKGTRLRPYLEALSSQDAVRLTEEITEKASRAYARQENGEIIFRFRRLFFTAVRVD